MTDPAPTEPSDNRRLTIQIPTELDAKIEEAVGTTGLGNKSAVTRMALERGLPILIAQLTQAAPPQA